MISDNDIQSAALQFGLRPQQIEKDYVYGWLLQGIYSRPVLGQNLVLKGGNALRKGYLPNTRFSKDLDFSCTQSLDRTLLERELAEVCAGIAVQTGVQFLDKTLIREKDLPIPGVDAVEARLYFRGFYGEENLTLKAQLDITEFDRIYLPVQSRSLIHPYADQARCAATIRCQKIEEILASKLTTLLHRCRAADLFDLLYAIVFAQEYPVVRREVITTFLRKSIFEQHSGDARTQLLGVSLDGFRSLWRSIIAPVRSLFDFEYAVTNFGALIESLFSVAVPEAPAFVRAPGGAFARAPRRFGGGIAYFNQGNRQGLVDAARMRQMVQLTYDGYIRLVEPYKLEYYVRKSDGRGQEYFWGWDTSGGKSGKQGIKMFICDKIQALAPSGRTFVPRFPVEL